MCTRNVTKACHTVRTKRESQRCVSNTDFCHMLPSTRRSGLAILPYLSMEEGKLSEFAMLVSLARMINGYLFS